MFVTNEKKMKRIKKKTFLCGQVYSRYKQKRKNEETFLFCFVNPNWGCEQLDEKKIWWNNNLKVNDTLRQSVVVYF
jgi:hypothetical protein